MTSTRALTARSAPCPRPRVGDATSGLVAPSAAQAPPAAEPAPPPAVFTARAFLAGYAQLLLVPVTGLAALFAGWTLTHPAGWPATVAAVTGWSLAVAAWLRHRGWPAATALLAAWAAPAALLAPLAGLGWLAADGLVAWGPVSAVLAVALAAAHSPGLVSFPPRARRV